MRGRKTALRIDLTPEERTELERRVRCTTLPAGAVRRARIILGVASGLHLIEVARRVGITEMHVRKWKCSRLFRPLVWAIVVEPINNSI